ncbi:MAG TPA: acyltransferase domain-containing protein, partial [Solirubrobacterales bacterium]
MNEIQSACEKDGVRAQEIAVDYAAHSAQIEQLEAELLEAFAPISPQSAEIPLHSTVTGEQIEGAELGAEYWYRNLRQTVLLEPVLRSLLKQGRRALIEIGPHPVLAFGLQETIDDVLPDPSEAVSLCTLRRETDDAERFALSLAEAHANGVRIEWGAFFKGTGAKRVPLPTYPFQRKRYWPASVAGPADPGAIGLAAADHPLLGAAIEDPTGEGLLLSGRISLQTHPWLADHAVVGRVILPGTAFLELALSAGNEVGAETVEELTLQAPLVLPEQGAAALRVTLGGLDEGGRREIAIHSRPEGEDEKWTLNASGTLCEQPQTISEPLDAWPPAGAEELDVADLYGVLADAGLEYGPLFQGLGAAWRKGERIYSEVALPEGSAREAGGFAIHPALLDAALHGISLTGEDSGELKLPFSWSGVTLQADGATELRVRLTPEEDSLALQIADGSGAPVAIVDALAMRTLDPSQLPGAEPKGEGLLQLEWTQVPLAEQAGAPAEVEQLHCEIDGDVGGAEAAGKATRETLEAIQRWLAEESKADLRLALITEGAMAIASDEPPDPAAAAIWGLVRSAQSEHPGRFALIDTDGTEASQAALPAALAKGTEEPQLALREGAASAPRAMPAKDTEDSLIAPTGPWHLDALKRGTLESLALIPSSKEPLGPTEVRIQVRAAGLNFRDVLVALGLYPGESSIGGEGAGVVIEVGAEVDDLVPGERVMGLIDQAFGPLATTERDYLAMVPESWSFEQAAALPVVFATAFYGLIDLAELNAGEKVLIHAGAGGVGMVAIQLAQNLGAEVFATASPSKWDVLREAGIDADHIASSRDLEFKDRFLATSEGKGLDVVLNALAGEFVDASLELLPNGGRFLEMGKTDIRDAA